MYVIGFEAGTIGLYQESADTILFVLHLCPDDRDIGDGAGGDPHLLTVDHILIAHLARTGAHAAWVRTEVGLSQPEASQLFPFLHGRQPVVLLLVTAKLVNRIHDQSRLHADKAAYPGIAPLQFLGHQPILDVAHPGAAVSLQGGAKKSQFAHGLHQFTWESPGAVAFLDDRNQVVFDELPRGVADQFFLVGEQGIVLNEIDTAKFDGRHDVSP